MRNSGIEINLNFTPVNREHVQWDISVNMTHLRNKVTMLPPERRNKQVDGYYGYTDGDKFYGEGLSMYTFYTKKYAGVSDEGKSMWYMDEVDKDNNLTGRRITTTEYADASDYLCGNPIPDLYGGFGTSLNFYGFDGGPLPDRRQLPQPAEHQFRIHAAVEDHEEIRRRPGAHLPELRKRLVLVQAPGLRPPLLLHGSDLTSLVFARAHDLGRYQSPILTTP